MPVERVTLPLLRVVEVLLDDQGADHYGYALAKSTGLGAATVQSILTRLEDEGWLDARWEDIDPHQEGRRPRRLYRVTGAGAPAMTALLREHRRRLVPVLRARTGGSLA